MNITVVGTGYVGLVSGVCLAAKKHNVTCVDIREEVVDNLNKGIAHIYEEDLDGLLNQVVEQGYFKATTNLNEALENSNTVIIAVGTPSKDGEIDLSQIKTVCSQIGEYIKTTNKYISVIVKSTVIPSTTDTFVKNEIEKSSGKKLGEFGLGMNPEFLKEGEAIKDFMFPDRVVIGFEDEITKQRLEEIYSPWDCNKIFVNTRTAEMIKYTNNTLLACLISINNELSNISSKLGNIDYNDVINGVITDKRWSPIIENKQITPSITSYFTPGAGFGGSCFPKDVQAIRTLGENLNLDMFVTNAVLDINDKQPLQVISSLKRKFYNLKDKKVLLLGLAFKPGTDDIRESSSLKILSLLLENGMNVIAHDPLAIEHTKKQFRDFKLKFTQNWLSEIFSVDLIIIGTNWPEYKALKDNLPVIKKQNIILYDTKRLFSVSEMDGVNYLTFGYYKNNG
jgi:UDPglucose 6-dehydrogenase/GDP-mannose 6-dehydrogenase